MGARGSAVRVTADGKYLSPPGAGAFMAAGSHATGRTATIVDGSPPAVVIDGADGALGLQLSPAAVSRAAARSLHRRGLVAGPASPAGAWDGSAADVLLEPANPAPGAARRALAAGLRSGGRPLLMDVGHAATQPSALVGAFDVGAAGAVVRTGDRDADTEIVQRTLELERARLDGAPPISVVVCNHNGSRYLDHCLQALARLTYPDYEVIVCDDGSTDDSVALALSHGVRVVELDRVGLSRARNAGAEAARGEVVAYIDGDTEAEPHWLDRIWRLLDTLGADGTGGPNLPFPDAGFQERAVSAAPGSSTPVVDSDGTAILLAGCNMAFRRQSILDSGGFDDSFRGAYDDVVFCLRLAERGGALVFHPTASIYHHRRDSITDFLRQQYAWGLGTTRLVDAEGEPQHAGGPLVARRGLSLLRLDMRHVFSGPQARQLYLITSSPLHAGLPLKALSAILAMAAATAAPAALARRLPSWLTLSAGALGCLFAVVFTRTPVFRPPAGPAGVAQRAATALLWFAQPAARRLGAWRAARRA